jgi:hypothetical protein
MFLVAKSGRESTWLLGLSVTALGDVLEERYLRMEKVIVMLRESSHPSAVGATPPHISPTLVMAIPLQGVMHHFS